MQSKKTGKDTYRIVMMVPVEAFIDVDGLEQAQETIDWLRKSYPTVDTGKNKVQAIVLSLEKHEGGYK